MAKWCNSFTLFCNEQRASVQIQNPHKSNSEVTVILGEIWRNLDGDIKQKYKVSAEEMRKVNLKNMIGDSK